MPTNPKLLKHPHRAARANYRQRRYDLAIASERLRAAAAEALSFANSTLVRDELELMLRELDRFMVATDLKVEWPERTPERQTSLCNILEGFGGQRRKPQQ